MFLCFRFSVRVRIRVRVGAEVRVTVSGNTFKHVFGQASIRASVLDPIFTIQKLKGVLDIQCNWEISQIQKQK